MCRTRPERPHHRPTLTIVVMDVLVRPRGRDPLSLFVNPDVDATFRHAVEAAAAMSRSPSELQERLRTGYPRIVVRARDLAHERDDRWYVYRDGAWVA